MKTLFRSSATLGIFFLSTQLSGASKFRTWQDLEFIKDVGPWTMQVQQETWFNKGKNIYYEHTDIGGWYTGITNWLELGAFYRYFMIEPEPGKIWLGNHAPHLDARLRFKHDKFLYQHRIRLQYYSGQLVKEEWVLRNEFLISLKTSVVELFASAEPFYNITTDKLVENYLTAGVGKKIGDHFRGWIYYRNQRYPHKRADREYHNLGLLFTLSF
jgi:hypothetical protein